ncbi:hypothetical protein BaRGS_00037001 [Batillaria attramentaria]|uniref:Uncharacterized protein n=1 Tax=Batillaria attramentaria TaxID=370345 RepID=A0ABD0JAD2_9CAEN
MGKKRPQAHDTKPVDENCDQWLTTRNKKKVSPPGVHRKPGGHHAVRRTPIHTVNRLPLMTLMDDDPNQKPPQTSTRQTSLLKFFSPRLPPLPPNIAVSSSVSRADVAGWTEKENEQEEDQGQTQYSDIDMVPEFSEGREATHTLVSTQSEVLASPVPQRATKRGCDVSDRDEPSCGTSRSKRAKSEVHVECFVSEKGKDTKCTHSDKNTDTDSSQSREMEAEITAPQHNPKLDEEKRQAEGSTDEGSPKIADFDDSLCTPAFLRGSHSSSDLLESELETPTLMQCSLLDTGSNVTLKFDSCTQESLQLENTDDADNVPETHAAAAATGSEGGFSQVPSAEAVKDFVKPELTKEPGSLGLSSCMATLNFLCSSSQDSDIQGDGAGWLKEKSSLELNLYGATSSPDSENFNDEEYNINRPILSDKEKHYFDVDDLNTPAFLKNT